MSSNPVPQADPHWQPLAGVRVVEFSAWLPVPMATAALADLGAEVIKVEPPSGDSARATLPAMYKAANRNKRSLVLNLKSVDCAPIIARLAQWADIVVEGFRPGVAARLGLGYDALAALNARLVYLSLSGYGQSGPARDRPGHDINYLAAAGALAYAGQWGRRPARSSLPISDIASGAFATSAILAALFAAQRSGKGVQLDLSMLESTLFCSSLRHGLAEATDPNGHLFAANDIFETADGQLLTLGILEDHFFANLCTAVRGFAPQLSGAKFADAAGRREHGDELSATLHALIRTRTAEQWLQLLAPYDLPAELCLTPAAATQSEHIAQRGFVQQADGEKLMLFPVCANGTALPKLRSAAPGLGEHTSQVLEQLQFSAAEIAQLRAAGAAH